MCAIPPPPAPPRLLPRSVLLWWLGGRGLSSSSRVAGTPRSHLSVHRWISQAQTWPDKVPGARVSISQGQLTQKSPQNVPSTRDCRSRAGAYWGGLA